MRSQCRFGAQLAAMGLLLYVAPSVAGNDTRFTLKRELAGPSEWITVDGRRLAFGAGHAIHVTSDLTLHDPGLGLEAVNPIHDAVMAGEELYLAEEGAVRRIALDHPHLPAAAVALTPTARGRLHLERLPDYLVVGEDGFGLRVLALPPPVHMAHHASHGGNEPTQIGELRLEQRLTALAASGKLIYAVLDGGELATIDAAQPAEPRLVSVVPLPAALRGAGELRDLAADGSTLYALGSHGLIVLEPAGGAWEVGGTHPDLGGSALALSGRLLHLARAHGVASFRDNAPAGTLHTVTVGNFFFLPQHLTIDVGDAVRWSWAGHAVFAHNVDACDGTPPAAAASFCSSQPIAAEGTFTSGEATASAFVFDRTFTAVGPNPYFCIAHVTGGMTGSVTVSAPPPPGVPDGSPGEPLSVERLIGSALRLHWDDATCGSTQHHVIAGFGSQLPSTPGGTFGLAPGIAQCDVGTSPFDWTDPPDAGSDPTGLLWFLVLADDGASTEGSWGRDGTGAERVGPAAGGASGVCGITTKDLNNACGQ